MSEHDVIDQLADYGGWLGRSSGLDLAPPAPNGLDANLTPSEASTDLASVQRKPRHRWLAAVAAVALLAGGSVWSADLFGGNEQIDVATAEDPPGPLYVLPTGVDPTTMTNVTFVSEEVDRAANAPGSASELLTVGIRSGDAVTDVAVVQILTVQTAGKPQALADYLAANVGDRDTEPATVELESGPAQVKTGGVTSLVQVRGDRVLLVATDDERIDYASAIADSVRLDVDGLAAIAADADFEVIESKAPRVRLPSHSLFFRVADGTDRFLVETVTVQTALYRATADGGVWSQTEVNGWDGWLGSDQDSTPGLRTLAWQVTPNRVMAVSSNASLEALRSMAESLEIVDEAEWYEARGEEPPPND